MVMSVWGEYDKAAPVLQEASVMAENRVEKQSLGFRFLRQEWDCRSKTWGATATAATSARHTKGSPLTEHQDITQSTIHLHRLCPGELGEGSRRHAAMMPSHMHSLVNGLLMLT